MDITKHLFFNLSLLMVIAFFSLVWFEKKSNLTFSKFTSILFFIFSLWICFAVSFSFGDTLLFDLREIPIVIAGLYLGIGPLISVICIIIRGFYGMDTGFFVNIALYLPLGIVMWRIHPWFKKVSPRQRIFSSVSLSFVISAFTVFCMEVLGPPVNRLDAWFGYMVIPPLGIGIFAFFIEFIRRNILMYQQLVKTEKLEAVEQMGAAISHEIRNPLTAAIGFVQLLKEPTLPLNKRTEYLNIVGEELQSAERVIQDYLTFSKPALEYLEELNVRKELTQVINILRPTANQYSVQITANFALVGTIRGDRQKFQQCFLNVIKNAIESMPNGGQLSIKTEYSEDDITIQVSDTGVGMTKEQLQKLGEPYYSTKGAKGTGLGMMVVFGIVKAMNGTIQVDSTVGSGTTFYFSFPKMMKNEVL
ncbi:sensor histidine kinase [Peribacillus deserti]|uniref:histidine kinase n=1 Tax=Peribacillus deserti TaxID=673318 RepID=A0A2N5M849_9BACI|nr:HAMP domain-containing sensor histidine kinase [Peribacillus deserti]PLT30539.1 histidine kinase [Peribacillus deserti]